MSGFFLDFLKDFQGFLKFYKVIFCHANVNWPQYWKFRRGFK